MKQNVCSECDGELVQSKSSNAIGQKWSIDACHIEEGQANEGDGPRNYVASREAEKQALEDDRHDVRRPWFGAVEGDVPVPSQQEQDNVLDSDGQGKSAQLNHGCNSPTARELDTKRLGGETGGGTVALKALEETYTPEKEQHNTGDSGPHN